MPFAASKSVKPAFQSAKRTKNRSLSGTVSACQKSFDKLVDGEASSPARCRASNLRFEPSAVSPKAKPENPKGFQPLCHPHQFLLKSKRFPGAKTARKRFLLWKMGFSGAKIVPCPPYTPLGAIESSRGLRPSRALRGFFDSLNAPRQRRAFALLFFFFHGLLDGKLRADVGVFYHLAEAVGEERADPRG